MQKKNHETLLPAVVIEPAAVAEAAVIWLHGLGADGHDFAPIVPELGLDELPVRFVFPHAPERPVTINNGYVMPAWYDINRSDFGDQQDEVGIRHSQRQLQALIENEQAQGISSERIVLAGFSQGGAMVLHTGLRYPQPLAGILALSTYLPLANKVADEVHPANAQVPVLMAHGDADPVIPLSLAEDSKRMLAAMGYPVAWHHYPMEHTVCPQEIKMIGAWLRERLNAE